MKNLFPPKKREAQPRNNLSPKEPVQSANDANRSHREATIADEQSRVRAGIGVKIIYEPSEPTAAVVDIIFVHGLTGDSANTWTHKISGTYWPATLLSCDIPNSRILSFGYDADVLNFWTPTSQNRIGNHASTMLGGLAQIREGSNTENRKIIFVAHSLGGLVTQDCLFSSRNHAETHLQQISSCTIGLVFLSTPNHGADLAAWAKFGATIAKAVKQANTDIVSVLERGSEMLARVQDGFHTLLRLRNKEGSEIKVTCFFEELALPIGMVVTKESAILPGYASYGIHADHMDMTKFDNKDNAGYRLVLGELRRWVKELQLALSTALTQTAPDSSAAVKPLFMVPFNRDSVFIDRAQIFDLIEEETKTKSRVALSGIGGVGKSQIAIEYCYRFREAHPDAHIVWVHSSTAQRLNQAYRDIARKLALPGWNDPKFDALHSVFEWLNEANNGQWLMVLDNADDLDTFFATTTSTDADSQPTMPLINYLPHSSRGLILITTRDARMSRRLGGRDTSIVVEAMLPLEAQELLRSRSERPGSDHDDISRILVDELAYIPLAITQAAAFISENEISLVEYLKILRTGDRDLQDLLDEDLGDLRRDSESQNSVIRTWKLSFDLISKQNPRAAEMLSLMAVLDRQGIPKSLLQKDADRKTDFVTARGILQRFSLIRSVDGGSKFELHRLVQLATRKWLEIQGTKENWQEKALLVLKDMFPRRGFENWTTCESLLPHAQTVTEYGNLAEALPKDFACLLKSMAYFDIDQGRYEIASTRALAAIEVQEKHFGLDHPFTLYHMPTLILVYQSREQWDEAEQLGLQLLEGCLKVLKEDHPFTVASMAAVALMYRIQERWDKAEELQLQVIEIQKRKLKEEHPDTLRSMNNLAATYQRQGQLDKAEKLLVRVIETQKRVLKEENPSTLNSMANLATTYQKQGQLDKAEELLEQMIETQKRVLKEENPLTLISMDRLASTYESQGRLDEAEKLLLQVIETRKRLLKEEHPDTLNSMSQLSITYVEQGRLDEAEKLLLQVIETQKRLLKEEHLDTLNSMSQLSITYVEQGRLDEAERLQKRVIEIRKRVFKEEHPNTIVSMYHLAVTYYHQRRRDEAIELMQVVVHLLTKTLGADHRDTLKVVQCLGEWLGIS